MSKKKRKLLIPDSATKQIGKYNVPIDVLAAIEREREKRFRWTIVAAEYIPQKHCKIDSVTDFLDHTISHLNDYERKTWDEILKKKNNHEVKSTQKLKSHDKIKHKIKSDVELYQLIGRDIHHRIFGYRENGVFHVMINDLFHDETPTYK